jgi:predicted nucleic acid-binding protein
MKTLIDTDAIKALIIHPETVTDEIREMCKASDVELIESGQVKKEVALIIDLERLREITSLKNFVFHA